MSFNSESSRSNSNESLNETNNRNDEDISLEVKFSINIVLNKFFISDDTKEFEFPSSLSSNERSYIHKLCKMNDLSSFTKGRGYKKTLLVSKKDDCEPILNEPYLSISTNLKEKIKTSLNDVVLLPKERDELISKIQKQNNGFENELFRNVHKLKHIPPQIPKQVPSSKKNEHIPVFLCKEEILSTMIMNRIMYIGGDTGMGKSDWSVCQIGQLVLENSLAMEQKCRIIVSEPFDLAAYHKAHRVAKDRGENIGDTVGYHISSEDKTNRATLLTYCTHEILMKNLMVINDTAMFNQITHVVLNDVHMRDKYGDLILILIKDILVKYKHIKFILIGSGANMELFQKYFNHCPVVLVPTIIKNIQEYYLEDILRLGEKPKDLSNLKETEKGIYLLEQWCVEKRKHSYYTESNQPPANTTCGTNENDINQLADDLIEKAWIFGGLDSFRQLISLIKTNKINVNFMHSKTMITPLMAACTSGFIEIVEQVLQLGANLWKKSCNDLIALEWAKRFMKNEVVSLIECYKQKNCIDDLIINEFIAEKEFILEGNPKSEDHMLLTGYYKELSNNPNIGFELIVKLVHNWLKACNEETMVIFLPSFDDILELDSYLKSMHTNTELKIFKVHAEMNFNELGVAFESTFKIKIILATNVIENSIVFQNVNAVIDTGIKQETSYDSETNSILKKKLWISKFCSNSRKNKVSHSSIGQCFRLYSRYRFKNFIAFPIPHILSEPTQNICMLAKLIVPFNTSITDLISRAPDSPAFLQLRNSINFLKMIDALDTWEDMSELGVHLINMPIELNYAKMILFSLAMNCLDPIVTIACCLSFGGLVDRSNIKTPENRVYSDHIVLYRIYQEWLESCKNDNGASFCEMKGLKPQKMNLIYSEKTKIIKYLEKINLIKTEGPQCLSNLNQNSSNTGCIKAALVACCYPKIIRIDKKNNRLVTEKKQNEKKLNVKVCLDSVVSTLVEKQNYKDIPYEWIIYDEMIQIGNLQYAKRCTLVSSIVVSVFSGQIKMNETSLKQIESKFNDNGEDPTINYKLDNWIDFKISTKDCQSIFLLRQKWNSIFLRTIKYQVINSDMKKFIELLGTLLDADENELRKKLRI